MKTMIRHITILMAVAMMVLLGGGCAEVNEAQQSAQPKGENEAIGFDVYTQRTKTRAGTAGDVTTSGLQTDTHKNNGFGVFAYYTGEDNYSLEFKPNFMYNQQVKYNSSKSKFTYEPQKYWPNEENHHVSFFAYAPWVNVTASTGAAADQTYGITGMTKNTATGDPLIHYVATTDLSKGVDLCWNRQLDQTKSSSAVNFTLAHALSKLNVKVQTSVEVNASTKIYIRSITFSGFTMKGSLNLNSATAQWTAYEKGGPLNKDAVTFYDGRRDGREGYVADDSELPAGLNPDLVQSWDDASPMPGGVTNSAKNLFSSTTASTPAYVIPTGDPVDITIEYDIETADPKLKGYFLSDGKTNGTSIANRITKTNVLAKLDAGKSYTLNLNLGIQDITFEASSVKDWKIDDPELVPLTFEAMEAGATVKFKLDNLATGSGKVQYSIDEGDTWQDYTSEQLITLNNVGDMVQFKSNDISRYAVSSNNRSYFTVTGNCYVYGNILSLVNFNKTLSYNYTFLGLFKDCSTIKNHDSNKLLLPATTLRSYCYYEMFSGCSGLTRAPALPATTLTNGCYNQMFYNCTNLTTAPALPATTLADRCYASMFNNCQSLTSAPALPATTLADYCYASMFYNCQSLTSVPDLSATTLASNCCQKMFAYCTSLTTAPALPATTLAYYCYEQMFSNCQSLTSVPDLPATTLAEHCYGSMFENCTSLTVAPNLSATTLADGCCHQMFLGCTNLTTVPSMPNATMLNDYCYFKMFSNCTSLSTFPSTIPGTTLGLRCCSNMFEYCSSLTTSPALPATTLQDNCYYQMFCECTSLTTASAISATTLANGCCRGMFYKCTSLTTASVPPATTAAEFCYDGMFQLCTSLTTAPALPATTLAQSCYSAMFSECSNLTSAPDLPAPTLVTQCYDQMFMWCDRLNSIKCLATDISASSCTRNWLYGVASNGTFTKKSSMASWTRDGNGIPVSWAVNNE